MYLPQISVSRSSTPDTDSHSRIVTTATVHHQVDSASPSITSDRHAHPGDRQPISDLVTCRGGGDSSSDRQTTGMSRTGSGSSLSNTNRGRSLRFFFLICMFYQLLRVQHSCSSIQSWGSVLPSIVETRDQNCPLLLSKWNLAYLCA